MPGSNPTSRTWSIGTKLTLSVISAALVAFALASAGILSYEHITLEDRARQFMESYAQLVSVGVEAAVEFEDPVRAQEVLNTLRGNPQILEAQIFLNNGQVLAEYSRASSTNLAKPPLKPNGVYIIDNQAELVQNLRAGAHFRLLVSLEEFRRQAQQLLRVFATGSLVLLAITFGLLAAVQRTIARPISLLAEVVEQVRIRADYSRRVPVSGTDEVARLGQGFNEMMEAVHARERQLCQITAFQRALLDNAPLGIVSATSDGMITSFNPAAEKLLGYKADEMIGKKTPACWHDPKEVAQRARELSEEFGETIAPGFEVFVVRLRHKLPEEHEWSFIRKDGSRVPVLLSITALRDAAGRVTGYVGMTHDLTERNKAEEALRQSANEIQDLYEQAPCGYHSLDENGAFVRINNTELKWLRYSREEVVGKKKFTDFLTPDGVKTFEVSYPIFKATGIVRDLEYELVRKDGSMLSVTVNATAVTTPSGQFIMSRSVMTDISERKRLQARDQMRAGALEKLIRGDDLHEILNSIILGMQKERPWAMGSIMLLDKERRHLGYGAAPGLPASYREAIEGVEIGLFAGACGASAYAGRRVIVDNIQTHPFWTKYREFASQSGLAACWAEPIVNRSGEVIGTFALYHHEPCVPELEDIDLLQSVANLAAVVIEHRQTQEEIRTLNAELEQRVVQRTQELAQSEARLRQSNRELETFSYSVAHDLRAPLRSIDGFSRILLEDYSDKLDEEGKGNLSAICGATERMAMLIDDLLELSKVTRIEMRRTDVNVSGLTQAVCEELRKSAPERRVEFVIQPDLVVLGDATLLRIVLENLFGNAWKYTGKKDLAKIEFGRADYQGEPAFFVRDNGAGFNMAYSNKLFRPFQRLHSASEFPGTGVGLATVQRIVERHGGRIWAESEPEKGATFYFTIP